MLIVGNLSQTLVFGADHTAEHRAELEQAKKDCVLGCKLAQGKPLQAALTSSLIIKFHDDVHHSEIIDKSEKRGMISQIDDLCGRIKSACADECVKTCSQRYPNKQKTQDKCSIECARGCKEFIDLLGYR